MNWHKDILLSFGLFIVVMVGMILLSNLDFIKKPHAQYCSHISQNVFNTINPELFVDYKAEAPENPYGMDFTVKIYDTRKINRVINKKTVRRIKPTKMILQKHRELFLVPILFLLALFIVTPLDFKTKLIRLPFALILFNLFMVVYLSYRFELALTDNNFQIKSIWLMICWLGGLGGVLENVFIIAAIIWAIVLGWPLTLKYYNSNS